MTNRLAYVALLGAVGLALAACSGGANGTGQVAAESTPAPSGAGPITIGQVASLTGPNYMGLENRDGAELAVQQINDAGGILGGRQVELKVEDDKSLPQGAVDAYGKLADQGVAAVVGTSYSNASLAVIPFTDQRKIVYVSTGAAHAQVDPVRPFTYMTPPTGQLVAEQLLKYFRDQNLTKIAVAFDSDSAFNRDAWAKQETLLDRYGIEAVAVESFKVDNADFSPTINAIAASGAQAIMAWVTGPPANGLGKAYADSGLTIPMVAGLGAASPAFVDAVGAGAEGIVVATSLVGVGSDLPESQTREAISELTEPFQEQHGHLPSQFAVDGYTAVKLIAAAIEEAGTDDPIAIQKTMDSLTSLTPEGEYNFSPTNHSGLGAEDVAVAVIRDGKFRLTPWSHQQLSQSLK